MAEVLLTLKVDAQGNAEIVKTGEAMGTLQGQTTGASSALAAFGPYAAVAAGAATALFAAVTSVAAGTAAAIASTAAYGSALADMSAKTHVSVQALQEYQLAAALVGVSNEQMAGGLSKLQNEVVKGNGAFKQLGLDLGKLREMSPDKMFEAVGASIAQIKNPAEQTAAAIAIFGRSGAELLPVLTQNLRAAGDEAERLGLKLSDNAVAAADDFDDATTTLSMAWEGLIHQFGAAALEGGGLTDAVEAITDAVADLTHWVMDHKAQIGEFFQIIGELAQSAVGGVRILVNEVGALVGKMNNLPPWVKSAAASVLRNTTLGGGLALDMADRIASAQGEGSLLSATGGVVRDRKFDPNAEAKAKAAGAETARLRKIAEAEAQRQYAAQDTYNKSVFGTATGPFPEENQFLAQREALARAQEILKGAAKPEIAMPGLLGVTRSVEEVNRELEHTAKHSKDWAQELQNVANVAQFLPPIFGQVLGSIAGVGQAMKGMNFKNAAGGLSLTGGTGLGGLLSNFSGGLQIAGLGLQLGKALFEGLTSSPAEKAGKTAAKVFGNSFKASDELSQAIADTAKKFGVGNREASLLNMSAAMKESGRDARTFGGNVLDAMNAIKLGKIPATAGLAEVGKAFNEVSAAALKAGSVGDKAMVDIIKRSRELGQDVPEIKAFVAQQLTGAAAGVGGVVKGIEFVKPEDAAAQATIFAATFWATVKEKGVIGAADAFKESFAGLQEKLTEGGFDASAILGDVSGVMNLADNEQFRGAVEGADALKATLEGLANSGYLTAEAFAAFGQQAQTAFDQAVAGGASTQQAYQALGPLLNSIESAHRNTGFEIDANTQAMIDAAKEAGVAFPTEPVERMANAMENLVGVTSLLAEKLGVARGELEKFATTPLPDMRSSGGGVPTSGGYAGAGAEAIPEFAAGVFRGQFGTAGTLAYLHDTESVVPEDQEQAFAQRVMGGGGGSKAAGGGNNITIAPSFNITTGADAKEVGDAIAELWQQQLLPQLTTAAERALG